MSKLIKRFLKNLEIEIEVVKEMFFFIPRCSLSSLYGQFPIPSKTQTVVHWRRESILTIPVCCTFRIRSGSDIMGPALSLM